MNERRSWKSRVYFILACAAIAVGVTLVAGYVISQYLMEALENH
jgi:SNF family Na+-dependent transporter